MSSNDIVVPKRAQFNVNPKGAKPAEKSSYDELIGPASADGRRRALLAVIANATKKFASQDCFNILLEDENDRVISEALARIGNKDIHTLVEAITGKKYGLSGKSIQYNKLAAFVILRAISGHSYNLNTVCITVSGDTSGAGALDTRALSIGNSPPSRAYDSKDKNVQNVRPATAEEIAALSDEILQRVVDEAGLTVFSDSAVSVGV